MANLNNFIIDFIRQGDFRQKALWQAKRRWAKIHHTPLLRNSDLLYSYEQLVRHKPKWKSDTFRNLLHIHKIRTLSGVAPGAVMTKPYPCPGKCIYCPNEPDGPKSYLSNEPAVMRAIAADYNPYLQVRRRIKQYLDTGHKPEKIELIVMGGSFSVLPKTYKVNFVAQCFLAANEVAKSYKLKAKSPKEKSTLKYLEKIQNDNEHAQYRIIGLTLETRPDLINPE